MDMSDNNEVTHHAKRDDNYSFLSDIERSAVERMGSTVGKDAIMAILSGLDRDALHSAINKFIQCNGVYCYMNINNKRLLINILS